MINPVKDEDTTSASATTSESETWPINEARSKRLSSPFDDELSHWEISLLRMGRSRLTRPEPEID